MSQTPRHINTDRSLSRPDQAARAPQAAPEQNTRSTAGAQHAAPPRYAAQPDLGGDDAPRRRKKKKKTPLWLPFAIVMGVIAVISGVVVYGVSLVNKVEDSIRPAESAPSIVEEIQTAEEYKGDVVNILVCGIDFEEGRSYSDTSSNDGMTDMILYCQFDIKGGALRMLQIPRNTLVTTQNRKLTLSNGKTYAVSNYQINSVALSNGGSIAALADVIYDQYHLPIDYYVTIDMQALVEMVDNFGGIEVYIPRDMSYGGSKLLKGYRNLDGASAEFFVRCRHGDGYANSDIDRLNMQRYFYAGLFKRARAMGITDILNQLPLIFKDYIHTDMDITTIAKLLASFLKIDSSNIILAQTPVFMGRAQRGQDRLLCRLLLRGAGCRFHRKPAQPVFLHLHRPGGGKRAAHGHRPVAPRQRIHRCQRAVYGTHRQGIRRRHPQRRYRPFRRCDHRWSGSGHRTVTTKTMPCTPGAGMFRQKGETHG